MEVMADDMVIMNCKLVKASVGIKTSYPSTFEEIKNINHKTYSNQYS